MSFAPQSLRDLMAIWTEHGGVNLGIVGDTAHNERGISYHLGADKLVPNAYSRRLDRDKAGLTNAASAVDFGKLAGSFENLRSFSMWLVEQGQHVAPGTSMIREIIYSPDGRRILRWDRERGPASFPREGEANAGHLTHTHISFYRDTEDADRSRSFRPFFGLPDTSTGDDDMSVKATPIGDTISGVFRISTEAVTIPVDGSPRGVIATDRPAVRHAIGRYALTDLDDRPCYVLTEDGKLCFVAEAAGVFTPAGGSLDCTDAVKADRAKAKITYGD